MSDQARIVDETTKKKRKSVRLTENNAADIAKMIQEQLK